MKKTYISPNTEAIRIATSSIIAASKGVYTDKEVTSDANLLGRDDDGDDW